MIKYFLYRKINGDVVSYSDGIIGYDKNIFSLKKIITSKDEEEKIKDNYQLKIVKGKIEMEKLELK